MDQENQILRENHPANKPDDVSSFIYKDQIYLYTDSGTITEPLSSVHKLHSFAKTNFHSIQNEIDEKNNDEYLMITQAENTAVHDHMVDAMFARVDQRLDVQFGLIMDNRAITQSIQNSVVELGIEIVGLSKKVEKLTKRVSSLESFRDKLLSGKIHLPGTSGGLGGFLFGLGSGIMKGLSSVGKGLGKAFDSVAGVVKDVVNGAKDLVEKVIDKGSDLIDHGLDVIDHTEENAIDTIKTVDVRSDRSLCSSSPGRHVQDLFATKNVESKVCRNQSVVLIAVG